MNTQLPLQTVAQIIIRTKAGTQPQVQRQEEHSSEEEGTGGGCTRTFPVPSFSHGRVLSSEVTSGSSIPNRLP